MSDYEASYAIRIHPLAAQDIIMAHARLAELTDEDHAADWYRGLQAKQATLATLPNRYPLAVENRLFRVEVRVALYQFGSSRALHRILFSVIESTEDAPYVHILHVRHGARKPMTRAEARKIEEE